MDVYDVIVKLVGPIIPVGEANVDRKRLENLKALTELVNKLVSDIDYVAYDNKDRHEHSLKIAGEHAASFLTNTLGIQE